MNNTATASNGRAAVQVVEFSAGGFAVNRYAPSRIAKWENRQEFAELVMAAARKLGYKRDGRCKTGWKKI